MVKPEESGLIAFDEWTQAPKSVVDALSGILSKKHGVDVAIKRARVMLPEHSYEAQRTDGTTVTVHVDLCETHWLHFDERNGCHLCASGAARAQWIGGVP